MKINLKWYNVLMDEFMSDGSCELYFHQANSNQVERYLLEIDVIHLAIPSLL